MMRDSYAKRVVCWLSVALMVSLCLGEMCFAQTAEGLDDPDSVATEPRPPAIYDTISPVRSISPDPGLNTGQVDAPDDTLAAESGNGSRPVYKRWWVWAVTAVVVGVLVALAGGGSSTKTDKNLPDFPDPPER